MAVEGPNLSNVPYATKQENRTIPSFFQLSLGPWGGEGSQPLYQAHLSTVPEFPGQYLISGAWSRVPEYLHKFVLLVLECGQPWPAHASDM